MVPLGRIELPLLVPETSALSTELQGLIIFYYKTIQTGFQKDYQIFYQIFLPLSINLVRKAG